MSGKPEVGSLQGRCLMDCWLIVHRGVVVFQAGFGDGMRLLIEMG